MERRRSPWPLLLLLALPAAWGDDVCSGSYREDPRWYDKAQGYFSEQACTPAVWFDRFFGDAREDDIASTFIRVIPTAQFSEHDPAAWQLPLKARVKLPHLENRFSLVFDDTGSTGTGGLPTDVTGNSTGNPNGPVAAGNTTTRSSATAALRYLAKATRDSRIDIDVGLRSQLKFFTRARYSKRMEVSPLTGARFTQSFYFLDAEGFGETSLGEIEYLPTEDVMVRWVTQATVAEKFHGLEMVNGPRIFHQVNTDRAVSMGAAVTTDSFPDWHTTDVYASVRYRQRMFRPWFFVEAEPFLDWARQEDFRTNPGITLRAEIWIGDTRGADTGVDFGRRSGVPATPAAVPELQAEPVAPVETIGDPRPPSPPENVTSPTSDAPAAVPAASQ